MIRHSNSTLSHHRIEHQTVAAGLGDTGRELRATEVRAPRIHVTCIHIDTLAVSFASHASR